jgi:hypothetical protein
MKKFMIGMKKRWLSAPPTKCDVCGGPIKETFVDGKTAFGPWACMCPLCHLDQGGRLGLGLGQKYVLQGKDWVKTEG